MATTFSPPSPIPVLSSAERTAAATSEIFRNRGSQYRGILLIVNVTVNGESEDLDVVLQSSSGGGDAFATVLALPTIDSTGVFVGVVHPALLTEDEGVADKGPLESAWRVVATPDGNDPVTYSVQAHLLA